MEHDGQYEDLRYLWDGNGDWCLWRCQNTQVSVRIVFPSGRPTLKEMVALRQLVDDLRNLPTSQVKALVGDQPEFSMGIFDSLEGHLLQEKAQQIGLKAEPDDASFVSYSIINRSTGSYLLMEDEEEHKYCVRKMLEAGRPVIDDCESG